MKVIKGDFSGKSAETKKDQPGESYSAMLLDLAQPYIGRDPQPEDIEENLQLAIIAWNAALSKALGLPGFDQLLEAMIREANVTGIGKDIIKEQVAAKLEKYPDHMNFIQDYKIWKDDKGVLQVEVISQSFDDFVADIGQEEEDTFDESQYEQGYVNRSVLMVKPKSAFWNWFRQKDPGFTEPEMPIEYHVYLVEEIMAVQQVMACLKKRFEQIFINELSAWTADEALWPAKRTYKLFCEFFEFEFHSQVFDLEEEPVVKG